tara:strand:- start:1651 stop:2778 length:1128 start_codon:yes stop_codon:yes gene_type:complete
MADKKEMTEEEAFELFQKALRGGQDSLDRLSPEVKSMAMGPAEDSLGGWEKPAWADLSDPSSEGYDPIVSPPESKPPEAEGYEPIVEPPKEPGPSKEFKSREEYKGFRAPKGMSPEQEAAWKEGIDDRLLEEDERLQERIESASPQDQMKDLLRRASEGDLEAIKDIGYFGLNVASMSPVGQLGQAAADVGVGGMDLAKGDYTGAAISAAASILPITAGVLKSAVKDDVVFDLLSKLDDTSVPRSTDITRPLNEKYGYMRHLEEGGHVTNIRGTFPEVEKMSDDELISTYRNMLDSQDAIEAQKRSLSSTNSDFIEVGKHETQWGSYPKLEPTPEYAASEDAWSRLMAVQSFVDNEMDKRMKTVAGFSEKLSKMR